MGERVSNNGAVTMSIGYAGGLICRMFSIFIFSKSLWVGLIMLISHWILTLLWWMRYGWQPTSVVGNLVEVFGLILQPSFQTSFQCLCTSAILLTEDLFFVWGVIFNFFDNEFLLEHTRNQPFVISIHVVEVLFRCIIVIYWYYKEMFISLLLPYCEVCKTYNHTAVGSNRHICISE